MRSTFIVGFPGETDDDFDRLMAFLEAAELDRVGCFTYSPVDGASANSLPDPVPEAVKAERQARFMALQARISREKLERKIGQEMIVLVDEVLPRRVIARSAGDAPEIDGRVMVDGEWELDPGDFIQVRITAADDHDLYAEPTNVDD